MLSSASSLCLGPFSTNLREGAGLGRVGLCVGEVNERGYSALFIKDCNLIGARSFEDGVG